VDDAGTLIAVAPPSLLDQLRAWVDAGGPVVVILLAMSVVGLAVALAKLYQFARAGVWRRAEAEAAVALQRQGRWPDALRLAERGQGIAAEVVALTLRGLARGRSTPAAVREEAIRLAADRLEMLRSHLRLLELVASLGPLLGLFGTVLGMIEAFQQLETAGQQVDPAVLSGGIWEALLTTAFGLGVAIPAVAILTGLERTVDRLAHDLDSLITRLFTDDLAAAGLAAARPAAADDAGLRPAAAPGE
jgi:biopolymer transport protein ExbB